MGDPLVNHFNGLAHLWSHWHATSFGMGCIGSNFYTPETIGTATGKDAMPMKKHWWAIMVSVEAYMSTGESKIYHEGRVKKLPLPFDEAELYLAP